MAVNIDCGVLAWDTKNIDLGKTMCDFIHISFAGCRGFPHPLIFGSFDSRKAFELMRIQTHMQVI